LAVQPRRGVFVGNVRALDRAEFPTTRHAIAHNKVMLIDRKTIITGSFNFSAAAEDRNAENLLVIGDDPALYAAYAENFAAHLAHAERYEGIAR